VRIATWNVNSLKVRMPRVEEWLDYARPDVLCVQETKLADQAFPSLEISALGYESAHHGDGQWNGVGILSRVGIEDVERGFPDSSGFDERGCRLVSATCGGVRVHSVYVPNGREVGSEHYAGKLDWLDGLHSHLRGRYSPSESLAVCGDFNIAPEDTDVWAVTAFEGATHVTEPERSRLKAMEAWGLVDAFRAVRPESGLYSWWDYRGGAFHKGQGMRIDLVLLSSRLADRVTWAIVDRNARKGPQPSDHAPVVVDFEV
jgi:exodeoxyribonuclease-3